MAAVEDARAREKPLLLRPREAVIGSRQVAHCRESAAEGLSHDPGALCVDVGGGVALEFAEVGAEGGEVHVSVDEPWHHHLAGRVDPLSTARIQPGADLKDPAVLDSDVRRARRASNDVEYFAPGYDADGRSEEH